MLIRTRLEELADLECPLHLALGVFDGVHIGHQAVISRALEAAARHGGLGGVLTFDPHPIQVIAPEKAPAALLATVGHKAEIVHGLGAGVFAPVRFDAALAALPAPRFLERLAAAGVRTIAVGDDWRFGRGRHGDVELLRGESCRLGYELIAVPPVMLDGERVSSTRVRQAIRDGNLAAAARMLGRPYTITGEVVAGRKLGRELGFPTANVDFGALQLPPDGVWAVRARWGGDGWRPGVANLGVRPSVPDAGRALEVHLLDFTGDLYGRELEVEFVRFLRPERKMESLEALRSQIAADRDEAARVLDEPAA